MSLTMERPILNTIKTEKPTTETERPKYSQFEIKDNLDGLERNHGRSFEIEVVEKKFEKNPVHNTSSFSMKIMFDGEGMSRVHVPLSGIIQNGVVKYTSKAPECLRTGTNESTYSLGGYNFTLPIVDTGSLEQFCREVVENGFIFRNGQLANIVSSREFVDAIQYISRNYEEEYQDQALKDILGLSKQGEHCLLLFGKQINYGGVSSKIFHNDIDKLYKRINSLLRQYNRVGGTSGVSRKEVRGLMKSEEFHEMCKNISKDKDILSALSKGDMNTVRNRIMKYDPKTTLSFVDEQGNTHIKLGKFNISYDRVNDKNGNKIPLDQFERMQIANRDTNHIINLAIQYIINGTVQDKTRPSIGTGFRKY